METLVTFKNVEFVESKPVAVDCIRWGLVATVGLGVAVEFSIQSPGVVLMVDNALQRAPPSAQLTGCCALVIPSSAML